MPVTKAAEWPQAREGMRKVRAPQGRMPANGRWRRLQGKCNREIPPGETPVRVERCGKSAPAAWRLCRHVNPIRCKMKGAHRAARPVPVVSLERVGDFAPG